MTSPPRRIDELETAGTLTPNARVSILVAAVALAAAGLYASTAASVEMRIERPFLFTAFAVAFAISERMVFHLEARNQAVSYTPSEIALATAVLVLNPLSALIASVAGGVVGMMLVRRLPLIKLAFNAALLSFQTLLVVRFFAMLRSVIGEGVITTWFALVASMAVAVVFVGVIVAVAVAQFDGGLVTRVRAELRNSPALLLPANIYAAAVAVPASIDARLGIVALAPAPIVWFMLRSHGALRHRFTDLVSIHDFSRSVGDTADLEDLASTAAGQISTHLRADIVMVRLWIEQDLTVDAVVGGGRIDVLPQSAAADAWTDLLQSRSVVPVASLDQALRARFVTAGLAPGLVAPITDDQGPLGLVLAASRGGVSGTFDDDDASRLSGMAQQLAVAVRKGQLHAQITFQATHDRLTGLPNRSHFEERIDESAVVAERAAVLLVDLDRFKQINDAFGHHAGDILLRETAGRIRAACADADTVARFGGDEFAVFAPSMNEYEAQVLAEAISATLEQTFDIGPASVAIGASIGIALLPDHGSNATDLLRRADVAMYDAKARRIRSSLYRDELQADSADRLMLLDDLRAALRADEIDVHFQPQIELTTGAVSGVEALARWEHPERGRISPEVFVELAEQAGLIEELTRQVLRRATEAAADWHRQGSMLAVSVNISAQSLLDERMEAIVASALMTSEIDPALLTLEITESTVLADGAQTHGVLHGLAELGVRLSVDDFGTGFSSLVNLRNLPVHEVKIDRSFVMDMVATRNDEVIVRSTTELARNLGLSSVAEGVETQDIAGRLADLGCDHAQGFGISRPLPRELFEQWLAAHPIGTSTAGPIDLNLTMRDGQTARGGSV